MGFPPVVQSEDYFLVTMSRLLITVTSLAVGRRGTDPQEPGIGRWQRLLGTQVNEC